MKDRPRFCRILAHSIWSWTRAPLSGAILVSFRTQSSLNYNWAQATQALLVKNKDFYGIPGKYVLFIDFFIDMSSSFHSSPVQGEITGMVVHVMVIVSIQVATVFALERCDNLVWRASQYIQNTLWSVSRLKHLVSPSHSNLYTRFFVWRF